MNVFVLDHSPVIAVQSLCDAHVVKMTLETAQILSTAYRLCGNMQEGDDLILYRKTHSNHPWTQWACDSSNANFSWLVQYGLAISDEYTHRFGKVHAALPIFLLLKQRRLHQMHTNGGRTTMPLCMPDDYKEPGQSISQIIQSYRNYYWSKSQTMHKFNYTKRVKPQWLS